MRRMGLCEEQGMGIEGATRVTLFGPRRFADMTMEERLRACYQYAALRYLSGERLENATFVRAVRRRSPERNRVMRLEIVAESRYCNPHACESGPGQHSDTSSAIHWLRVRIESSSQWGSDTSFLLSISVV